MSLIRPVESPQVGLRRLNTAFLQTLSGQISPDQFKSEIEILKNKRGQTLDSITNFYQEGLGYIEKEIDSTSRSDEVFARRLGKLAEWLVEQDTLAPGSEIAQQLWSIFFPEGNQIWFHEDQQVEELRRRRKVQITKLNPSPIVEPLREMLFTSNVLLTLPAGSRDGESLPLSEDLKHKINRIKPELQRYWYDHPIPMDVSPQGNEVLYGLRGLQDAVDFEIDRGKLRTSDKLTCLLSVSVTHDGIMGIAKDYLEEQLAQTEPFESLEIYVFTEADTQRLIHEILIPAAVHYLHKDPQAVHLEIFGVNGAYGRHYSFLKAIAAFWSVLVDPQIKGTFKFDLDQVFPQGNLLAETGICAFENFRTPLWGSKGCDASNRPIELGMIAGALVNEADIDKSIYTPDVGFPDPQRDFTPDEYVFFSQLPQALSTRAEMLVRYNSAGLDGKKTCLQRVHVTGGTNGILIDSLRRYRPFSPSFFGRAEDQAYLMSVFHGEYPRLGYLHKDGLVMRHDKAAFAQDAIQAAHVGKTVGDYERILYFSAYAEAISENKNRIKEQLDPFTGCFISYIPVTLCLLRFCLKIEALYASEQAAHAYEFTHLGARRLASALNFAFGEDTNLKISIQSERDSWDLYYDILDSLEDDLNRKSPFVLDMQTRAKQIVRDCLIAE